MRIATQRFFKARLPLVLLVISLLVARVYPCLNEYGTDLVGKRIEIEGLTVLAFVQSLTTHEDRAFWNQRRVNVKSQLKWDIGYDLHNNLAVALAHLGQTKQVISILEDIEKKRPGKYGTAVNLGTAYELNGENEKALRWIKEGIQRNSQSHLGTEWLHVKILEAKLALAKDSTWLQKHSVLGVDFGTEGKPQTPNPLPIDHLGQQKSMADVEEALVYQLHERLEFTKKPDPLVADLLFDLGNVLALTRTKEHAQAVYQLSLGYEPTHSDLVNKRLNFKDAVIEPQKPQSPSPSKSYLLWAIAAALLITGGLYFTLKRRNSSLRRI
jgi:tetratricopeptide (TPR) repeat protein